jgi:predicted acylesterase/phospholipase RssA
MTRRLEHFFADTGRKRRILALDGGGVRGLMTLGVLAELEEELRRRSGDRNYRLSQYFDLIGGTSTGSIIATGLAFGWPVEKVQAAYRQIVPKIFGRTSGLGLFAPRYREKPLVEALTEFFGDETLESPELETGLAIFAKRMNSGSAWVFCNNPRWNFYDHVKPGGAYAANRTFLLRSLVQASAAAPHYFRGVKIVIESADPNRDNEPAYFIDGGVGGYNNPALELLTMARDPAYGFNWPAGADNLYILSVGTGWARERAREGGGLLSHLASGIYVLQTVSALRGMINDVSLQQIAYLQAMSQCDLRWYINREKQLQGSSAYLANPPVAHYQRIDVRFDPETDHDDQLLPDTAQVLLGKPLKKAQLRGLLNIANANRKNADLLTDLGEHAGKRVLKIAPPPPGFDPNPWSRQGDEGPGGRRNI